MQKQMQLCNSGSCIGILRVLCVHSHRVKGMFAVIQFSINMEYVGLLESNMCFIKREYLGISTAIRIISEQ